VAEYRFLTTWLLDAPREQVFEAIHDQEAWPSWWRGVTAAVELEPGEEGGDGVGSLSRLSWRSRLPYDLDFEIRTTRVVRPHLLEGEADGELAGTGTWRLYEEDGTTAVIYDWNVRTTRAWMNLLAPLARPVFAWNHDWVMARGGEGIARLLGCRLLAR
jgi:uncharacterized protein YndB with AHSA1/START domain